LATPHDSGTPHGAHRRVRTSTLPQLSRRTLLGGAAVAGTAVALGVPSLAGAAVSTPLLGANFGSLPDESLYRGRPDVARLYFSSSLPTSPVNATWRRAYNAGVRTFVVSWKDSNATRLRTFLRNIPSGVKVYGCYFHEPEDDIERGSLSLKAWRSTTVAHAAIMKSHGVIPTTIIMGFTLIGGKGRRVTDYMVPEVSVFGTDYYPDKVGRTVAEVTTLLKNAAVKQGSKRYLIGEFGILKGASNGPSLVKQLKTAVSASDVAKCEAVCYWSQDQFVLTAPVADAFFV
jgi:hypothetical protein